MIEDQTARRTWATGHPGDSALQKQGCGGAAGHNDDDADEKGGADSPTDRAYRTRKD